MKFKADENLPFEVASLLREAGFDAHTVWDETLSGAQDEMLADLARTEARVFLTLDLDFANIRAYPPSRHAGIIVLRPPTQDKLTVLNLIRRVIPILQDRRPAGELWIVQSDRIRFRH
ncbi:MAG: DUF5615 family PIN-like protein [Acidobacteria bacterium]|nr:DUF5615 family PIN-like protein [Acidobacteriota bacterium]